MLSINTQQPLPQRIKQQTEAKHLALESLIVSQISAVKGVDDYAQLLHLFYSYMRPVETAIQKLIDTFLLPDIQKRQKTHLILQDLNSLGFTHQPPLCTHLPAIASIEQAFGALYVLEGSTLGGKSIKQLLLKTNIGLQPENLCYFTGYGAETGSMWMTFLNYLNRITAEAQQKMSIETANDTFIKFKHWIQQQTSQIL